MAGSVVLVALLQLLALGVILTEFLVPSMGVLTTVAVLLAGYSIYEAFVNISPMAGTLVLMGDVVLAPFVVMAGLRLLGRSAITLKHTLPAGSGERVLDTAKNPVIGSRGVAVTDLRPSGIARIDGRRIDVVTPGGYVESGSVVLVVGIEGNQVLVEVDETHQPHTGTQPGQGAQTS